MSLSQSSLQVFKLLWEGKRLFTNGFPWSCTLWTATFFCLWWALLVWLPIGLLGMVVLLGAMDLVSVVVVVCLVCECGSCECGNCSGFCGTRQSNRGVSYHHFCLIFSFLFYILTLSHIFIFSKKDLMRPEQLIDVWHPANTVADYEH